MLADLLTTATGPPATIYPTSYEIRSLAIRPEATRQKKREPKVLTMSASNTDTAIPPVAASLSAESRQENITDTTTQPVTSTREAH